MSLQYQLKTIRKTVAYDEVCLSALIWLGDRQVGKFRDCPDTGKPIFEFDEARERLAFERHIEEWWASSEYVALCSYYSRELVDKNNAQGLPINTKMRCWISLESGSMDLNTTWKWPPREANQVLHSFRTLVRIADR